MSHETPNITTPQISPTKKNKKTATTKTKQVQFLAVQTKSDISFNNQFSLHLVASQLVYLLSKSIDWFL